MWQFQGSWENFHLIFFEKPIISTSRLELWDETCNGFFGQPLWSFVKYRQQPLASIKVLLCYLQIDGIYLMGPTCSVLISQVFPLFPYLVLTYTNSFFFNYLLKMQIITVTLHYLNEQKCFGFVVVVVVVFKFKRI